MITGTNLAGATVVAFDGVAATEFTIDDPTQITAKVPTGATTGPISVTTPGGTATSAGNFTVAASDRIFGPDAIDTSIAISQAEYPDDGTASSVVLARSDFFPDALAGGPLAAHVNGPLLITPGAPITSVLDPRVLAEINRLLDPGDTVHVLGGPLALSPDIDATLTNAGYGVERVYGANQFSTAVAIANQLGAPGAIFEATGWNFPDALSAVPAAIKLDGVIVLTNNNVQAPETQAYITAHPSVPRFAIGGPLVAGGADPGAVAVYGQNQYGTSAAVATKWFTDALLYGVATGANFPDALSGGVFMATGGRMGRGRAGAAGAAPAHVHRDLPRVARRRDAGVRVRRTDRDQRRGPGGGEDGRRLSWERVVIVAERGPDIPLVGVPLAAPGCRS